MGIGGGKGGGSSTVVNTPSLTPEQRELLRAQTDALTKFYLPAYKQTTQGAGNVYNQVVNSINRNVGNASNVLGQNQSQLGRYGSSALRTGIRGLESLYSPQYEQEQIRGAIQPYQEQNEEQQAQLAERYGAAGALGSARAQLAQRNLGSLNAQRIGNVVAGVKSNIAGQRQDVGKYLSTFGQGALGSAGQAAQQLLANAQIPQDVYAKYASIIFGNPQQSISPDFRGTQGGTTNSSGSNWGFGASYSFK